MKILGNYCFCDLRSHYIRFTMGCEDANAANQFISAGVGMAEGALPFNRLCIRMGDVIVEDIRNVSTLNAFLTRTMLPRSVKRTNWEQGWDTEETANFTMCTVAQGGGSCGATGKQFCISLGAISGIMSNEVLQSCYYMP